MEIYNSFAKINIGLRVVNRREDGFHNLESIFQEVSLADEIRIRKQNKGVTIHCNDSTIPTNDKNLCYRAYQILLENNYLDSGVEIQINKRIPAGSGLGGGSSNAATCLKALNSLFELKLSISQLLRLSAQIGSDVPFFIVGGTAMVKGRGEVVIPISFLTNYQILIVFPHIHISTGYIYKNFEMGLTAYQQNLKFDAVIKEVNTLADLNHLFFNDLENVVLRFFPELVEIKNKLKESGAEFISLSGSGSAVFGIFDKDINLNHVTEKFPPRYELFIVNPVS